MATRRTSSSTKRRAAASPSRARAESEPTSEIRFVEELVGQAAPSKKRGGSTFAAEVKSIFLPVGYPESVRPEYLRFQAFDTLQAACSYLRNVLTTSAILKAAGVGEEAASPMAAALTWVLRDGIGMFGSLLFSYVAGANFDVNVKEWRLFADVINDVGLTLDMLAPLAGPTGGTLVASLGAACKTICGLCAGATRASITAHFALQGNLADVSAKEGAQETAVTLIGLILGGFLAKQLGDQPQMAWAAFLLLTLIHVWANVQGVGSLTFETFNPQRARLTMRASWRALLIKAAKEGEESKDEAGGYAGGYAPGRSDADLPLESELLDAVSPRTIARQERLWGPMAQWWKGPTLGVALDELVELSVEDGGAAQLDALDGIYQGHGYLLRLSRSGVPKVALKSGADGETALFALLHCAALELRSPTPQPGLLAGLDATRLDTAGGTTLGVHERRALTNSLALCDQAWPRLKEAWRQAGWKDPCLRLEHCGRTRVRIER